MTKKDKEVIAHNGILQVDMQDNFKLIIKELAKKEL